MSCATSTLKFVVFLLNFLIGIYGALTVSACVYFLIKHNVSDSIHTMCILGIILGVVLFLTSIFGCYSTFCESTRSILVYVIIILILIFTQIGFKYLMPFDFNEYATEIITNAWNSELYQKETMSKYEIAYECCGKNGPNDYVSSGLPIPTSCYRNQNATITTNLFKTGCAQKLADAFQSSADLEEISDWSLVGIESLAVIVASILGVSLKNKERRLLYR